jgi:ABC-type branched-subunit amino acid transport system substrate-binding protein
VAAIESAVSTDPQSVREGLTRTKDFPGVTGNITFAAGNRIPLKSVDSGGQEFEVEILPKNVPPPR